MPISISYAVSGKVAVIGSSTRQVEKVIDTQGNRSSSLGASSTFTSALADLPGQHELFYLDMAKVLAAIRAALPPGERFFFDQSVTPNAKPISVFEWGASISPSLEKVRFFLKIP